MLALALALLVAQPLALEPVDPEGPIITNPATMWSPAWFEFAPANGRGMADALAKPLPNWAMQSEGYSTASWGKGATGVAIPSVVADQAVAPDGTLTGDSVTFAATGVGQDALVNQTVSTCASTTCTHSTYVKGQSGSGTLDVCGGNAPYVCTSCAYTSTGWTRCSVTLTHGATAVTYVGNATSVNGGITRASNAVYIWGHVVNVGSTAAPYVATTTAAKGYTVTGAKGEALTFSRTGVAYAQRTASGGLATTGIANGDLVLMPGNAPRVEYDPAGVLGLRVESARTNSAIRSQEFDNANWTKTETAGAVTITANAATAPDGTLTAERIQFSACPTAGQESVVRSLISGGTTTTGAAAVFLRGNGTSGSITLSLNNSGGYTTANATTTCSFVSTEWRRCVLSGYTATSNAASELIIGCSRANYGPPGVPANTGAADVFVWQADYQAGASYITSPIPTTSAAAARNADQGSVTLAFGSTASGFSQAATVSAPDYTTGSVYNGATALYQDPANRSQLYLNSTTQLIIDVITSGGNRSNIAAPGTWSANTPYRIALAYSGAGASSVATSYLNGVQAGQTAAGATAAFSPTSFQFQLSPGVTGNALVSRVCVDPSPTRCR